VVLTSLKKEYKKNFLIIYKYKIQVLKYSQKREALYKIWCFRYNSQYQKKIKIAKIYNANRV